MEIKIKYFDKEMPEIKKINVGDWIDLRVRMIADHLGNERKWYNNKLHLFEGMFYKLYLGVAMELPEGYEAIIAPRSSTFRKYGFIIVNSPGVIDESYKGDNDEWFIPIINLLPGEIEKFDRVCQFRIQKKMEPIEFKIVKHLDNPDRGGDGSTGRK